MKFWFGIRTFLASALISIPLISAYAAPQNWWIDITNDRAGRVTEMLENGADPNEISPGGQPAIMQAIRDGSWKVYDVLVNHPQTVYNAINVNRETPLMYLAVVGETERAIDIIKRGALVNRKGWTPLHYAASTGQLETAQMLLDQGALVNAPAPDDTTPLMMAAYGGSEPMVRLLLEAGADLYVRNKQNYDVVDWAGFKSNTQLAGKLRALMDAPLQAETNNAESIVPQASADSASDVSGAARQSNKSSTSRYFDLDRFDEPVTP